MDRLDRVFIDTTELFPYTIMDVLLTLAENRVFLWHWSDELIGEWERVIVREGRRTAESAQSVTGAIRTHFGHWRIDPAYRDKVNDDLSPDPGDRVHVAAVLHGGVNVVLTRNLGHWQSRPLRDGGVKVITADDYLCDLLSRRPEAVVEAFIDTADVRRRPPVSALELADRIGHAGAPKFAALIKAKIAHTPSDR